LTRVKRACLSSIPRPIIEKLTARGVFWCADMDQEQQAQKQLVGDQFTRTAQVFGDEAVASPGGRVGVLDILVPEDVSWAP